MRIAIMGFRGIPARYGGFGTFVEELAPEYKYYLKGISQFTGKSVMIHFWVPDGRG